MEYPKTSYNKAIRGSKRASYDQETIYNILDAEFLCHLAYNYEDCAITIPMAYGRKENSILLHGSLKNRMLLQLLAAEKVSLTVTILDGLVLARSGFHHSANYRSVTLFGSFTKIEERQSKIEALKCITNHMVPNHWEDCRPITDKEVDSTLVVALDIQEATAKVRAEGVIDEKSDLDSDFWAGVVPLRRVASSAISDPLLKEGIKIPEAVENYIKSNI
jgi:nitroimidazol reductase NimA-like FMN-containing flavoprotein (pyridoxamine 5'-phosphate oxidase superfamily)